MRADVYSDYLCPWCYVGQDRTQVLRELGVEVTPRPYELHPRIPVEGVDLTGRGDSIYSRIEEECAAVEMPFRRPDRLPNTRGALETAEYVRLHYPSAFDVLDRALFDAHFVEGRFLGDPEVLDDVVTTAGADAAEVRAAIESGAMAPVVDQVKANAIDAGVTGTPAWVFDTGAVLAGVQRRDLYERVVIKLRSARA